MGLSLYRLLTDYDKKANSENCIQTGEAPPRRRSTINKLAEYMIYSCVDYSDNGQ